jgi:sulfate transport system permease protein
MVEPQPHHCLKQIKKDGTMQVSSALKKAPVAVNLARAITEPPTVRLLLIGMALLFLGLLLFVPLVAVFIYALQKGFATYLEALREPDAFAAIKLTLSAAGVAVTLNLIFGLAAARAIAKFEFPGKNFLITFHETN